MEAKRAELLETLDILDLENIPKQYQQWIDTIGLDATISLCDTHGGVYTYAMPAAG